MGMDNRLDELEQLCHDVEPISPRAIAGRHAL
jgi:hypothetical protein